MMITVLDSVSINKYDLFRQNVYENWTLNTIDGFEKPGLTLAKTCPWLKGHRGVNTILHHTKYLTYYLNQKSVKEALHIPPINLIWKDCTNNITYNWQPEASLWIYTVLKTSGSIRMMHYSGDTDGVLPTYGTKNWIESLGWDKIGNYTPWVTDDQVSGFVQKYEGLDFATVKGVGHMAPLWKRKPVADLITKWVHEEDIL